MDYERLMFESLYFKLSISFCMDDNGCNKNLGGTVQVIIPPLHRKSSHP
jgi:hypothetical protein